MSIVSRMIRTVFMLLGATLLLTGSRASAQGDVPGLTSHLDAVYQQWRHAMITKNYSSWQAHTAAHRRTSIVNRIHSERRRVSSTLFNLPAAPPDTRSLKLLDVKAKGVTANLIYFGPVDFGVGGKPPNNLLVLSFVREARGWKYDTADYVNLASLPAVRAQLESGQLDHLKKPEFLPAGAIEEPVVVLRGPVNYIAKTYVYCPGREVRVMVNGVSRHLYQNTKDSEVIIGGARDGRNEVQFTASKLPGGQGTEPMTIRVYLMSQVAGVKPIKIFQYQVMEDEAVRPSGTDYFEVGPAEARRLRGQ